MAEPQQTRRHQHQTTNQFLSYKAYSLLVRILCTKPLSDSILLACRLLNHYQNQY